MIGLGVTAAPRWTAVGLRLLGVRWEPRPESRAAGWALVGLGLVIAVLSRSVH